MTNPSWDGPRTVRMQMKEKEKKKKKQKREVELENSLGRLILAAILRRLRISPIAPPSPVISDST